MAEPCGAEHPAPGITAEHLAPGDIVTAVARVFWVAVGAAAGVWAYRRGSDAIAAARERSALENLQVASQTATKVAATGAKVVAVAGAQGAKVAARLSPPPHVPTEPEPTRRDPAPAQIAPDRPDSARPRTPSR